MMVLLDDDADLLHLLDHFGADVLLGIGRADREIAALVRRLVTEVRLFKARGIP